MARIRARVERFALRHPQGVNLVSAVCGAVGGAVLLWLIAHRVDTNSEVLAAGIGAAAGMVATGLSFRFALVKEWRLSRFEGHLSTSAMILGGAAAGTVFYGWGGDIAWSAAAGYLLAILLGLVPAGLRARELWRSDPEKARGLGEPSKELIP